MAATSRDPEAIRERALRAAEIAEKLRETKATEGWSILTETFERQRQQYYDRLARDLMAGKDIDQRKLDYNRGFFESVGQLLEAPENADKVLARAVEKLKKAVEEDTGE